MPKLIIDSQDWVPIKKKKENGQSSDNLSLPLPAPEASEISAPAPAVEASPALEALADPPGPPHSQVLTVEMIGELVDEALNQAVSEPKEPVTQPFAQHLLDDPIPLDPAKLPPTLEPAKDCFTI